MRLGLYPSLGVAWYWGYLVREGRAAAGGAAPLEPKVPQGRRARGAGGRAVVAAPLRDAATTTGRSGSRRSPSGSTTRARRTPRRTSGGTRSPLGIDLEWEAKGPVFDYPMVTRYEQSCLVTGEILIGNEAISFDGWGQRDHSWGVRDWWGDRLGVDGRPVGRRDRLPRRQGARPTGSTSSPATSCGPMRSRSRWRRSSSRRTGQEGRAPLPGGDGDAAARPRPHDARRCCSHRSVSDAPDGRMGRFPRGLCRFDAADGRSGYGWTEWNRPG